MGAWPVAGGGMTQGSRQPDETVTVEELVREGAARLEQAGVFFGHGTDNALDESAQLVFHALALEHDQAARSYRRRVDADEARRVRQLLAQRIETGKPAAYLVGEAWFAGLRFQVDERVLVPRSPLAELVLEDFEPWIDAGRVSAILDLCTGSGCIGIAAALQFPNAQVDLSDLSEDALQVARANVAAHRVGARVSLIHSDLFEGLGRRRYDVIVCNPPYVAEQEYAALPVEYRHEPGLGLVAGPEGLDLVHRILARAADHLRPGGILVMEVGSAAEALERAYPRTAFTWLEFEHGGSGVFTLTREELQALERPAQQAQQESSHGR